MWVLGDLEAGIQNIDQAQRLMQHPQVTEDPQVLNALGIALLLTNRPRRAEDLFKQSIKLCDEIVAQSPSGYEAYYHKMIALAGLLVFDQAEILMERSLSLCRAKGVVASAPEKLNLLARNPKSPEEIKLLISWLQEYS